MNAKSVKGGVLGGKAVSAPAASEPRTVSGRPVPPFLGGTRRPHFLLHILQPEREAYSYPLDENEHSKPWRPIARCEPLTYPPVTRSISVNIVTGEPRGGACTELWTKALFYSAFEAS